jgi:DNA-binding winged helix-turn-helix (wHTH) protein/TolB-like protein
MHLSPRSSPPNQGGLTVGTPGILILGGILIFSCDFLKSGRPSSENPLSHNHLARSEQAVRALVGNSDYRIGRFTLRPFRQLLDADVAVPIGHKALDLLSVLAKAEGGLVTKDELMTAVWRKAVVEDNALQVHIAALRKALGTDAGLLSTVHGLGYRLAAVPIASSPGPKSEAPPQAVQAPAPRRHATPVLWLVLAVIAAAGPALWLFHDRLPWIPARRESRVAVLPFDTIGPGKELRGIADGLFNEIVSQLSDNQIQVVSPAQSKTLRNGDTEAMDRLGADLVLDGTVQGDGKVIDVRVHLDDVREHVVLWSGEFHGAADATEALEASVAAQAADVLYWTNTGRSGKVRLDAPTLATFIAGRESTIGAHANSEGMALSDYRKVVTAAPDFSWGHSAVAEAEAYEVLVHPASNRNDALRADALLEAKRALALEPHNGEAWLAREFLAPPLDWQGREALLVQGIAADPNFGPIVWLQGHLLWNVGRGRDALVWFRRAHDISPPFIGAYWSLALNLASEGRLAENQAVVAQMALQWPDNPAISGARVWTNVVSGATDDALTQLADLASRPSGMDRKAIEALSAVLKNGAAKEKAAKTNAAKAVMEAVSTGSLGHGSALMLLAMLGDLDDAFAQAQLYEPLAPNEFPYLFLPTTAAMRSDPRFMPLARKLGLVAYWRVTGKWPDFCSEPGLTYDCRGAATKLAAQLRRS